MGRGDRDSVPSRAGRPGSCICRTLGAQAQQSDGDKRLRLACARRSCDPGRLVDFISPAMLIARRSPMSLSSRSFCTTDDSNSPWFTAAGNIAGRHGDEPRVGRVRRYRVARAKARFSPSAPGPCRFTQADGEPGGDVRSRCRWRSRYCCWSSCSLIRTFSSRSSRACTCRFSALGILWQSFRHRVDNVDFDVYKRDARDLTPAASPTVGSPQARPFESGEGRDITRCDSTPDCVDEAQLLAGHASLAASLSQSPSSISSIGISQLGAYRLNGTTFAKGTAAGFLRRALLGGR